MSNLHMHMHVQMHVQMQYEEAGSKPHPVGGADSACSSIPPRGSFRALSQACWKLLLRQKAVLLQSGAVSSPPSMVARYSS